MSTIFDYIYSIDGFSLDSSGAGICIAPNPDVVATGTCGSVGICTSPLPTVLGTADWAPFAQCVAPLPEVMATTDGYRPAWGECAAPLPVVSGTAHVLIESVCIAPPAFAVGYTGAIASNAAPAPTVYALSGYNRTASGAAIAPNATVTAISCGLDKPLANSATSSAVVALLQQGNSTIADAAATICAGCTTDDAKAAAIIRFVAGFTYAADSTSGIGDRWTCALPTLERRYGDCEDGAILLQSLILAIGIDPGRVMTCFGTVAGDTTAGHAWTIYRRESDEEWVPLEWSDSAFQTLSSINNVTRMVDRTAVYTAVSHILTSTAFTAITTAKWLLRVTTLRATGDMTAPCPDSTGWTNISSTASMKAPAATAFGYTGAQAALAAPLPNVAATAHAVLSATGVCVAPLPTVAAGTGARGDCTAPLPQVSVLAGARCDCAAPLPTVLATAAGRALVQGAMTAPVPVLSAHALTGILALGECLAPLPRCYASDIPSAYAEGRMVAPHPRMSGHASINSTAAAALVSPLPIVRAHARNAPAWATSTLQYDASRLPS